MDEKGLLVSLDAIMGMIVVMILLGTVVSATNAHFSYPSQEVSFSHDAQDAMSVMTSSSWQNGEMPVLSRVAQILQTNNNTKESVVAAGEIAGEFLNLSLGEVKYNLTENKQLNGTTLACNGEMKTAKNVDSATRTWGNYSFSLYVWK